MLVPALRRISGWIVRTQSYVVMCQLTNVVHVVLEKLVEWADRWLMVLLLLWGYMSLLDVYM